MNGTHAIEPHAIPHTELVSYRVDSQGLALKAAIVGGGALVLAFFVGLAFGRTSDFLHAYLAAFLFWFGLSAGSIGLTMLHHLTGGRWGDVMRPLLETGARGVFLMALLGIPILLGMGLIYPWAQETKFLSAKLIYQRDYWTSPVFFAVRYVLYFVVLGFLAWRLNSKYRLRDEMAVQDPEHNSGVGFRVLSGPGILVLGVIITLCTVDWAMSVQAGWFSTLYGLLFVAGMGLTTFAFMTVAVLVINRQWAAHRAGRDAAAHHHPVALVGTQDWHDLGNLMLAFTMLWGYMSLSQMLIIYSGNLPAETVFYNFRSLNGWQYVGGALIALHWALPFLMLLMRDIKRDPRKLVVVALLILLVRQLDFYYQIHPSYAEGLPGRPDVRVGGALGLHTLLNVLTVLGIGGLWVAFFAWNLQKRRVLPAPAQEDGHHG
jgi:hypothetical protein